MLGRWYKFSTYGQQHHCNRSSTKQQAKKRQKNRRNLRLFIIKFKPSAGGF
jgi:hypothetical protein